MILTFGNSKAELAQYVDTGRCATDPSVLSHVNQAMMRLLMVDDWRLAVQKITFQVTHNVIILPEFVDTILRFRTCCGVAGNVWGRFYEFSPNGPGQTTWNGNPGNDLVDLGISPFFYEIEVGTEKTLAAFSTSVADASKILHIRGITSGRQAMTETDTGIELPINRWSDGIEGVVNYDTMQASTETFSSISHIVKPATAAHVTLLSIDMTTKSVQVMGVYQPWETTPGFRRYKIVNHSEDEGTTIVAACKMRYVPMRHDNDPLIIQNLPALISMLQAMREEKAKNIQLQQAFENKAIQWLFRQAVMLDEHKETISVQGTEWGMSDAINFQ